VNTRFRILTLLVFFLVSISWRVAARTAETGLPPVHPGTVDADTSADQSALPPIHPGAVPLVNDQSDVVSDEQGQPDRTPSAANGEGGAVADDIQPSQAEPREGDPPDPVPEPAPEPAPDDPADSSVPPASDAPSENPSADASTDTSLDSSAGPPTGPRDLLRRMDLDDSHFDNVRDHEPVGEVDEELILKLIDRLRQFRLEDLERWAHTAFPLQEVWEQPDEYRGQIFWMAGRLIGLERFELPEEMAMRFGMTAYYRCTIRGSGNRGVVQVYTRRLPDAWKKVLAAGETFDERVTLYGCFMKFAGPTLEEARPVFVARRVAWHPPTKLGNLGYDVGLLDTARTGKPLGAHDREAFYAMLAAVMRAEPGQLMQWAQRRLEELPEDQVRVDEGKKYFSVVPLFNDPRNQRGKLFWLQGTARRIQRIEVNDPDIRARYGIDHYYQIALFTPDSASLGGYRNPIWFCVRELPEGMPSSAKTDFTAHVRVAGFFLKTWAYRRDALPEEIESGMNSPVQLAPLLIGRRPIYIPPPEGVGLHPAVGLVAGLLFVVALAGIWIAVWRYNRADREFQRRTLAKQYQTPEGVSLNDLGIEARDGPDFTGLREADSEGREGSP